MEKRLQTIINVLVMLICTCMICAYIGTYNSFSEPGFGMIQRIHIAGLTVYIWPLLILLAIALFRYMRNIDN